MLGENQPGDIPAKKDEDQEEFMDPKRKDHLLGEAGQAMSGQPLDTDPREEITLRKQDIDEANVLDEEARRLQEILDKLKPKIDPPGK